jgi:hypothetical protein
MRACTLHGRGVLALLGRGLSVSLRALLGRAAARGHIVAVLARYVIAGGAFLLRTAAGKLHAREHIRYTHVRSYVLQDLAKFAK